MKIFISQPMKGKPIEEIKRIQEELIDVLKNTDTLQYLLVRKYLQEGEYEVINTIFTGYNGNRLQFLGKSIMEGLALADVAVFVNDWEKYDGCRCEHFIASQYKIPCLYVYAGGELGGDQS